jgi:hypothetical protein
VAKKAVVLTTILKSIYLPVKPLNISPACINKHCFVVRSLPATTWQLNDSPFELSQITSKGAGDSHLQHAACLELLSSRTN